MGREKGANMIFEHSRFNSKINSGYLARDIIKVMGRGSATAKKIATVLNEIHKSEHISSLNRINNEVIKNYENYLKSAVSNKELAPHTAQSYASALNAVVAYVNLRTDKNLKEISAFAAGIKNSIQYGGKSTSQELYNKVYTKLQENQQIKQDLQRNLFLRVKESHCIKKDTIENALQTGILALNRENNDGTKNSRGREVKIRTEAQRNALNRALNYMTLHGQKSMIENDKKFDQALSKYYRDIRAAGGTKKNNNGNNFSHGNRHAGINDLADNILPSENVTNAKEIDRIISSELGHGDDRTTDIYRNKH